TSLGLILIVVLALAACGGNNNAREEDDQVEDSEAIGETENLEIGQETIRVPYVSWASESISTQMLANLLEQVGYTVDVSQVEAGPMFSSVADGSADFHTSAWFPATHASYWEEYEDDLVRVNETIDSAPLALTVPSYVEDVNTMED